MKRKAKKFGDGGNVTTRSDDEIAADNKAGYGRYMPKTKEYTLDEVKDKLSGLFGGSRDESKFSDLESVKKTKTLAEQIGREAPSKVNKQDSEAKSNMGERAQSAMNVNGPPPASTETVESTASKIEKAPVKKAAPAPKKNAEPQYKPYPKDAKPLKPTSDDEKAAVKKRAEQDDADQERLRKQFEKNKADNEEAKKAPKKAAKKPGDVTFLTKERSDAAQKAIKGGWSKGLFERGDLGIGKKKEEKKMAKGGSVSSASKRADGIAMRGKTKGRIY